MYLKKFIVQYKKDKKRFEMPLIKFSKQAAIEHVCENEAIPPKNITSVKERSLKVKAGAKVFTYCAA